LASSDENDSLARAKEIANARRRALEVLQQDAELERLQAAAGDLGGTLVEAADDEELWNSLTGSANHRRAMNAQQRLQLEAALDIDWSWLLDRVGYHPPPPSAVLADELVTGIRDAVNSPAGADAERARQGLRELGTTLVELSSQVDAPKPRLRRWLRRGARIAGRLVIVAGVAAGGVALAHVAPIAALGGIPAAAVVDTVKEGATWTINWVLDRMTDEERSAQRDEKDPADRAALAAISSIDMADFGRRITDWEFIDAMASGAGPPSALVEEASSGAQELVERAIQVLYRFWDAALGAQWFTPGIQRRCDELRGALRRAREAISEGSSGTQAVISSLEIAQDALTWIGAEAGNAVGHG
jgi:hypothetical protein